MTSYRPRIDRGPVEADDYLDHVSRDRWHLLLGARRGFIRTHLPYDCRQLVRFVQDAERMAEPLGFEGIEDFLRRGLEIDPELVEWALRGLAKLSPDEQVGPVPFVDAVEAGRALVEQTEPAASHGGERPGERGEGGRFVKREEPDGPQVRKRELAERHGSDTAEYVVARLKRDAEHDERARELLEAVREGSMKPNAAAVALGWRKKKPTVTLDEEPDRAAARLVERFGREWALEVARAVFASVEGER
jgi:hypothetical protein